MSFVENWLMYLNKKRNLIADELKEKGIDIEKLNEGIVKNTFCLDKKDIKDLKIACIMDTFTYESYKEECQLKQVTPNKWQQEIEEFKPDLLFVESAWHGKDSLWYRKIANISKEYFELTSYCQENEIPVIFWNKEDPVYTDTFMPAARCADYVFTTDIDCIKKYKENLKHDKVFLLHFAAQPKIHNPFEKYERKDKFCFAGAYYHRYPKRAETFDKFAKVFIDTKGFDIYDRNYQNSRPEHAFPESYNSYILGRLEPGEIDIAYKGYFYGINMNSVDQSQTMFARRVFEMMASNTVTVGNYSRGVKNLFGDLTVCTNDEKTLENELNNINRTEVDYRKFRLQGLRKVLSEHLYEDRLAYIVKKVFMADLKKGLPQIKLILNGNVTDGIRLFEHIDYENKQLYIIDENASVETANENIVYLSKAEAEKIKIDEFVENGMVGILSTNNYYGKKYLLDLALSTRYSSANAFGKVCYYSWKDGQYKLEGKDRVYKVADKLLTDRSIFGKNIDSIQKLTVDEFSQMNYVSDENMLATDEFNFCENYNGETCEQVDDSYIVDQGICMADLEKKAESIKVSLLEESGRRLSYDEILTWIGNAWKDGLTSERLNAGIAITSKMAEENARYIYFNHIFEVKEYEEDGKLNLFFGGNGNLEYQGVCVFLDKDQNKLSPGFAKSNIVASLDVPSDAQYFRLALRLKGTGKYTIQQIELGVKNSPKEIACFLNKGKTLILTNAYPSEEHLYKNMFVHKRVKAYKEQGVLCDVMEFNKRVDQSYREFDGVSVVSGQEDMLRNILSKSTIETVCVHFLDANMWTVLKEFREKIRIVVWMHGADIQPWWRRTFNYQNKQEEEAAKSASKDREALWHEVFDSRAKSNIHFVFVSQTFANEIFEDYKISLDKNEYSIIHNCIDTDMFLYAPKDEEQRKKILAISPYASRKYANDLRVKCIMELSKKEFFDELEFCIYGDGVLFEETLKPLEKFKNIEIHRGFLRQDEIAQLHKQYGIFLVPTRWDSQGVSRDEAMASGMVIVTNAVAAVPEFADENCAILVSAEDSKGMADKIEELYKNPDLFLELSKNAHVRVEGQTSKQYTIDKEVELIKNVR